MSEADLLWCNRSTGETQVGDMRRDTVVNRGTVVDENGRTREGRSATEAFLYRHLESLPESKGRFGLNTTLRCRSRSLMARHRLGEIPRERVAPIDKGVLTAVYVGFCITRCARSRSPVAFVALSRPLRSSAFT